jgi:hypothetical protein
MPRTAALVKLIAAVTVSTGVAIANSGTANAANQPGQPFCNGGDQTQCLAGDDPASPNNWPCGVSAGPMPPWLPIPTPIRVKRC